MRQSRTRDQWRTYLRKQGVIRAVYTARGASAAARIADRDPSFLDQLRLLQPRDKEHAAELLAQLLQGYRVTTFTSKEVASAHVHVEPITLERPPNGYQRPVELPPLVTLHEVAEALDRMAVNLGRVRDALQRLLGT